MPRPPRKIIPYHPKLKAYARRMRNNPTPAEERLWTRLKGKQILGYDFHRQKPLGNRIADFFCYELMLAIEVDGKYHELEKMKISDAYKEQSFKDVGLTLLRFKNEEVFDDLLGVVQRIETYAKEYEQMNGRPEWMR